MKKLIAILLTLTLIFTLAACGGKTNTDDATGTDAPGSDLPGGSTDYVPTTAPTAQGAALGVEPILFGVFATLWDLLFLGMKRVFLKIVSDAQKRVRAS